MQTKWFILHELLGKYFFAQKKAVQLNFPDDIRQKHPEFLSDYTVSMANALTPRHPAKQLKQLQITIQILIATQDELFDAEKMMQFCMNVKNPNVYPQFIHAKHLDIIFNS